MPVSEWLPPIVDVDCILLAGDIHNSIAGIKEYIKKLRNICGSHIEIAHVRGNHEYYGDDNDLKYSSMEYNLLSGGPDDFYSLECSKILVGDVTVLGATLWTSIGYQTMEQYPGLWLPTPDKLRRAEMCFSDFKNIIYNKDDLQGPDWFKIFKNTLFWLTEELDALKNTKTVVITHHAPSYMSLSPSRAGYEFNYLYASHLEEFIKKHKPTVWCHGHIHCSSDYLIGDTRVLCNPRGYVWDLNPRFQEALIFEL